MRVKFIKINGLWYFDYPGWTGDLDALMMVGESADYLDRMANGADTVEFWLELEPIEGYEHFLRKDLGAGPEGESGATYQEITDEAKTPNQLWLCDVTKVFLMRDTFPDSLYVHKCVD